MFYKIQFKMPHILFPCLGSNPSIGGNSREVIARSLKERVFELMTIAMIR